MLAGKLATAGLALKSASYLGTNDHVLLKFDPSLNADAVAASLYRTPGITGVSPNLIGEFASTIPNDPYANGAPNYKQRWHDIIHTIDRYDDAGDPYAYHGAWAYTTGSSSVVAAVIDNGVNLQHVDLTDNLDTANDYDFVDNDVSAAPAAVTNGTDPYAETHGTSVAGIIAGRGNNGQGVAGVSWNSKILPLRIGDLQTPSVRLGNAVEAINYAVSKYDNGMNLRVLNCSFTFDKAVTTQTERQPLYEAIEDAGLRGIMVAAAAGNQGTNVDLTNDPNNHPSAVDGP